MKVEAIKGLYEEFKNEIIRSTVINCLDGCAIDDEDIPHSAITHTLLTSFIKIIRVINDLDDEVKKIYFYNE